MKIQMVSLTLWSLVIWCSMQPGLAASHTAHWKISLSDDKAPEPQHFIDLAKWTPNSNSTSPELLIVAPSLSTNTVNLTEAVNSTTVPNSLPAEAAEDFDPIVEDLTTTTTTTKNPMTTKSPTQLPSFTVFGQTPNFSPLFGFPFTLPTPAPIFTIPAGPNETITLVPETNTSSEATTVTSSTPAVDLPTLPPFDMRGLPSLIQMAKLIPAMVRSFSSSAGESLPSAIPSGLPFGAGTGSLYQALTGRGADALANSDALPTSSAVLNSGGQYGNVGPAVNAAPTFTTEPTEAPNSEPGTAFKTREIGPFGQPAGLFSAKGPNEERRELRRTQIVPADSASTQSLPQAQSWAAGLLERRRHAGIVHTTGSVTTVRPAGGTHVGTPNSDGFGRKIAPEGGSSRGSAHRRRPQISDDDRRARLRIYEPELGPEEFSAPNEPQKSHKSSEAFSGEKIAQNEPQSTSGSSYESQNNSVTTISPYAAPMPTVITPANSNSNFNDLRRRERPRFDVIRGPESAMRSNHGDPKEPSLASIHRGIFGQTDNDIDKRQAESAEEPAEGPKPSQEPQIDANESENEAEPHRSARVLQKFDFRLAKDPAERQLEALAQRFAGPGVTQGLDANALRDLIAIKDLPDLGELTRGLDLSLLTRPGGYATLRQQFIQRLARRSMLQAAQRQQQQQQLQQQQKKDNENILLRMRRTVQ